MNNDAIKANKQQKYTKIKKNRQRKNQLVCSRPDRQMSLKLCSSATHSYMVSQIREAAVQYILYYAALCLCNKMLWSRILTVIVKFGVGKKPWLLFRILILQIDRNDDRCNFQFNSSSTRQAFLFLYFLLISLVNEVHT